jgi:hypothetical protein
MAYDINLGPAVPQQHPTPVEKAEIRKQIGLGTSALLNAHFYQSSGGDISLDLSDPTNVNYRISLSKIRLADTTATRLLEPRAIYMDDYTVYAGDRQRERAIAAGTITKTGNARISITSKYFNSSVGIAVTVDGVSARRLDIDVPVLLNDTPIQWAEKVRGILNANPIVVNMFVVDIDSANKTWIHTSYRRPRAQDGTFNVSLANGTGATGCTGIIDATTSILIDNGSVIESPKVSDIETPISHRASFDGTSPIQIVGQIRPSKVLRRHIADWDRTLDNNTNVSTGLATGISTPKIQDGAITPSKISVGGPTWDTTGNTYTIGNLGVEGNQIIVDGKSGGLLTTTINASGSGYVDGTHKGVQLIYFSGNTATAYPKVDIVVVDGAVTTATLATRGSGFTNANTVMTFADVTINPTIGALGSGAKIKVATFEAAGDGGRLTLSGPGEVSLTNYDSTKSWQLATTGTSPGDFEIRGGNIDSAITAASGDSAKTNIGLRIVKATGEVNVLSLKSKGTIEADNYTIGATPATATGPTNDFDGIAKSARVWTNGRTLKTNDFSGTNPTDVKFSFGSVDGSADISVQALIGDDKILNKHIAAWLSGDTTVGSGTGISTDQIRDDAVTSAKLEDNITIAKTLTVQKTIAGDNQGIKFSDDATRISVSGNDMYIVAAGDIKFGVNGTSNAFTTKATISSAGKLTCAGIESSQAIRSEGDVIAYSSSDAALKDNIKNIQNPLSKINKLNGVSFTWNSNQNTYSGYDIGVVAQEVQDVFPEIVTTREDGYKAVRYEKLIPLLIECIKELNAKIDALK